MKYLIGLFLTIGICFAEVEYFDRKNDDEIVFLSIVRHYPDSEFLMFGKNAEGNFVINRYESYNVASKRLGQFVDREYQKLFDNIIEADNVRYARQDEIAIVANNYDRSILPHGVIFFAIQIDDHLKFYNINEPD